MVPIPVRNSLYFSLCTPAAALFSEALKLPTVSTSEGVSECMENFPPSQLLPRGTGPIMIPFSLSLSFSLLLLPYSIMGKLTDLFGSLWSSASFQLMLCSCFKYRCIFDVFVGMEGNGHVLLLCHLGGPPITHLFFFIHLSVGGHLGGFHILSTVNNISMNIALGCIVSF